MYVYPVTTAGMPGSLDVRRSRTHSINHSNCTLVVVVDDYDVFLVDADHSDHGCIPGGSVKSATVNQPIKTNRSWFVSFLG